MTLEQWNAVINTNLGSLFNMTRQVIEGMRARKFGRIINISSINGQKGQFGQVNYSAAKAGDIGFTKALALENARGGITVNAICPGYINTEMVQAVPKDVLEKNILPLIPVGRLGEPEEIARAVVFLASDDAGFITGSTLIDQRRAVSWPDASALRRRSVAARNDVRMTPALRHAHRLDGDPDVVAAGGADRGDRPRPAVSTRRDDVCDRRLRRRAELDRRPGGLRALRQPLVVWLVGVGGLFGYHALYFIALRFAPPAEAGLLNYLWPLLIVLFSSLLPGERLAAHHIVGALLGLAGTILLFAGAAGAVRAGAYLPGFTPHSSRPSSGPPIR